MSGKSVHVCAGMQSFVTVTPIGKREAGEEAGSCGTRWRRSDGQASQARSMGMRLTPIARYVPIARRSMLARLKPCSVAAVPTKAS